MKKLLQIAIMLLLPLSMMAQRTIENPVEGARSAGAWTGFYIDKIELSDNATKLFMTNYHGYKEGWFRIASSTMLRAGDKQWKVLSAEGVTFDKNLYPEDDVEFITHFVLNFPAIDKSLETVDFMDVDSVDSMILFDVALTDKAAEEIKRKNAVPDEVKNYDINIKDNGKSLEPQEFTMEYATVKGKFYGYDERTIDGRFDMDMTAYIYNPFLADQIEYTAEVKPDGTYELKVPMTTKHQTIILANRISNSRILVSAGKTVVVDFDYTQSYKPWELPNGGLIPYFSGENVDVNFALNSEALSGFSRMTINGSEEVYKRYANLTMAQYKDYIMGCYNQYREKVIDVAPFTKRAKECLLINLKSEVAYLLSMGTHFVAQAKRVTSPNKNDEQVPDIKEPVIEKDYLDYPKLLDLDNDMMFYADKFSYNITGWRMCFDRVYNRYMYVDGFMELSEKLWKELDTYQKLSKKEKQTHASVVKKNEENDTIRTEAEKAFVQKYAEAVATRMTEIRKQCAEEGVAAMSTYFSKDGSYFLDFIKLQEYCRPVDVQVVVPDSIVAEIEKMRFLFYAKYVKAKNAEIVAKIEAEKKRGGYYLHQAGESEGDSLLVDLLKDYKGKVVLIDFWNTWCGPCRSAIKKMAPMEESFEGKDVEFIFIADESSPLEEYNSMIVSMKGHHYRLSNRQASSLKKKWGFTGIPSYVIIGKDGMVKDFHTGFHGSEYYKAKIEEELKK